ncbi:Molybdenum cofactor sulfurase [Talaromyces pinophilus]|nr:Molybdenum cofactor sulfurase [Talaromyces pinophilus]
MANQALDIAQEFYPESIDEIRDREYPTLRDVTYLDHAGTTLYAKSLIEKYSQDLTGNLFGNPHSASASSQLTSNRVEDIRLKALRFFNADPDVYDLVFVPNATAGIKLVAESLRDFRPSPDSQRGFWYGYHVDSHTSLVGVRALADLGNRCFSTNDEVRQWINDLDAEDDSARLFAYPAQSNMNGRRFPLRWCNQIRQARRRNTFTLLDAASLVSTSPLDLSDPQVCPDFVVLSFYKIFGFPDLGALIVRKESGHVFSHRRYFGGGTVGMVTVGNEWYARKQSSIHDQLEDGTLPFHNIIALDSAFRVHELLYGSMANISTHTAFLAKQLFDRLSSIKHANGKSVCHFYLSPGCSYEDRSTQGPIIALNLLDSNGDWIGKSEIEKLASVKSIHIRSGTLCNPGGTASLLGLSNDEMEANYKAGQRCGDENDIMQGKPTGALRSSLGPMTSSTDIDRFVSFITEFYAEQTPLPALSDVQLLGTAEADRYYVESLCVYPIKSCSGFTVPPGVAWKVRPEGLAWDREWCIVHQGTGVALSQKRYPHMALIKPILDFENGFLRIIGDYPTARRQLDVPLSRDDPRLITTEMTRSCQNSASVRKPSLVCGDRVVIQVYTSSEISAFFSDLLGVPCTLARFPPRSFARHSKNPYRHHHSLPKKRNEMPGTFPLDTSHMNSDNNSPRRRPNGTSNPILLSNESPILLISRSSVNRLNEQIKEHSTTSSTDSPLGNNNTNTKTVAANVFRANIVIAENLPAHSHPQYSSLPTSSTSSPFEQPYIEDTWSSITIGQKQLQLDVLGACSRCQMVCVDQMTAEKREEPLSTLAKTRRVGGKVIFGRHLGLSTLNNELDFDSDEIKDETEEASERTVMVGDTVVPSYYEQG